LIVDPVTVGGLSLEGTAPRDEEAMVLLNCVVVVEEKLDSGLGVDIYIRLALQKKGMFSSRFTFASFCLGKQSFLTHYTK
jgi:hypothetical protein